MEWLRPSSARSNVSTSASARDRMPRPCCVSCRRGSHTTTRFTRTRLSVIVRPVSSSQLTKNPDRVRPFGGYNSQGSSAWTIAKDRGSSENRSFPLALFQCFFDGCAGNYINVAEVGRRPDVLKSDDLSV